MPSTRPTPRCTDMRIDDSSDFVLQTTSGPQGQDAVLSLWTRGFFFFCFFPSIPSLLPSLFTVPLVLIVLRSRSLILCNQVTPLVTILIYIMTIIQYKKFAQPYPFFQLLVSRTSNLVYYLFGYYCQKNFRSHVIFEE